MRAFFADGLDRMHVPWAVEGLPTLIHLSLFLFFAGLAILLFHVDLKVFSSVVWWIGLFAMVYISITLLPLIRNDSPYHAPLSTWAWFLFTGIPYVVVNIVFKIATCYRGKSPRAWTYYWYRNSTRWENFTARFRPWMLGGVEKAAEVTASKRTSEIDIQIFDWTISALGDDISLEKFFEAIPGFIDSNLVHNFREHLSDHILDRLSAVAHGFMGRTWSSNSVSDSEKLRRLDIVMNAMVLMNDLDVLEILRNIMFDHWNEVPKSIEMGHTLARWCSSDNHYIALYAQSIVGCILGRAHWQERNDSWVTLAALISGLAEHDLRDDMIADGGHGDSALLALLIQIILKYVNYPDTLWGALQTLCKIDMTKTLPRVQHDFCTLWNDVAQRASKQSLKSIAVLELLHPLYVVLHRGTDACPAAFSAPTYNFFPFPVRRTYPSCNIAGHQSDSDSTARVPSTPNSCAVTVSLPVRSGDSPEASESSRSPPRSGGAFSQQVEQGNIILFADRGFPQRQLAT